jgi:8-amino-7-oxononanoate synthase
VERKVSGTYRKLKSENLLIDFCSNDYLGFARSPILKQKIIDEVSDNPGSFNGATGSRLLSGNLAYTENLEKHIAALHHSEAGLLYNSGYDANVGLFSALLQKGDTIITDELIHASIIDGARLSYANRFSFRHNDLQSLEDKLKHAKGTRYVAIETVYSMDGDTPPFLQMLELTEKYGANLIVDEAHAFGLYGFGLIDGTISDRVFARVATFGKALGCHGAIVLGSNELREYLVNFSRSFIYSTAASFYQLASIKMAYQFLMESELEVQLLKDNIASFRKAMNMNKTNSLIKSDSAIQCIVLNSNERARSVALAIQESGFDVRPILSPSVPAGTERIRICLHSFNLKSDVILLAQTINKLIHA